MFDDHAITGPTCRYFDGMLLNSFAYGVCYTRFDPTPLKRDPTASRNARARVGETRDKPVIGVPGRSANFSIDHAVDLPR